MAENPLGQSSQQPGSNQLLMLIATLQSLTKVINQNGQYTNAIATAINNKFPNWVAAPANTGSAGIAGQVAYDGTHLYVCVSTNSWGRILLDFAF